MTHSWSQSLNDDPRHQTLGSKHSAPGTKHRAQGAFMEGLLQKDLGTFILIIIASAHIIAKAPLPQEAVTKANSVDLTNHR